MLTFSFRLRSLRLQRDLTQLALAERSGVHVAQLSRYERGLTPTLGHVVQLAHALSVDVRELSDPVLAHAAASVPAPAGGTRG